jgi:hypothetical protein
MKVHSRIPSGAGQENESPKTAAESANSRNSVAVPIDHWGGLKCAGARPAGARAVRFTVLPDLTKYLTN